MDPHPRAEPLCVLARVCNIVLVREKDMRNTAGVVEPLHELRRKAWRIDEEIAARARDEVGVRPEGRARIEPAAPHAVAELLWKDGGLRPYLLLFAAYRRGWTHEHRAPGGELLFGCRRLPREDALALSLDDQIGRNVARGAAIDARAVDVPVAGHGFGIAGWLHWVLAS